MLLPKRNFIGPLADFKLGSASTNVTESVKYLGVHIDNNLGHEIYFKGILPSVLYSIAIWGIGSNTIIKTDLNIKAARFINHIKKTIPNEATFSITADGNQSLGITNGELPV